MMIDNTGAGTAVAVGVLVASTVFGLVYRMRSGRLTEGGGQQAPVRTLASIGLADPAAVNLVQFSASYCSGCRVVRLLCADLVAEHPGLRHVDLDVAEYPAAVDEFAVSASPTLLILDAAGRTLYRCTGVPDRAALRAAIGQAMGGEQTATAQATGGKPTGGSR